MEMYFIVVILLFLLSNGHETCFLLTNLIVFGELATLSNQYVNMDRLLDSYQKHPRDTTLPKVSSHEVATAPSTSSQLEDGDKEHMRRSIRQSRKDPLVLFGKKDFKHYKTKSEKPRMHKKRRHKQFFAQKSYNEAKKIGVKGETYKNGSKGTSQSQDQI